MPDISDYLLNKYKEVFQISYVLSPIRNNDTYNHVLIEEDNSSHFQNLTITNVPQNSILLDLRKVSKLNLGDKMNKVFKDTSGLFKCCDYLILFSMDNQLFLIYIEMKSKGYKEEDISQKFKGAYCFIKYCDTILEQFFGLQNLSSTIVKMNKVLISKATLNKQPTNAKITSIKDFYHYQVTINNKSASIQFKKLCKDIF